MLESSTPLMVNIIKHYVYHLVSICNHQIQIKNVLGQMYASLLGDEYQNEENIRPLHNTIKENELILERILKEQFGENGKHIGSTLQYSSKLKYFTCELLSRVCLCDSCHLQNTEFLSIEKQEEQIQCLVYRFFVCSDLILDAVHSFQNHTIIIQSSDTKEWWIWISFLFEDFQLQGNVS